MHLPFTHMFIGGTKSIGIVAGGDIKVFETSTGEELWTTVGRPEVETCPVISAAVHGADPEYLVTVTDDKTLRVWRVNGLTVVSERTAPKKPTDVKITRSGETILISDKFGDIYSYPFNPPESQPQNQIASSSKIDVPGGGKLLMGHVSLLTTFLLTPDEKFIITADRDEHIRVSWYPEAYVIERYCLGHTKFVSAIHVLSWDPTILISGGGDTMLKIWNWQDGKRLLDIEIASIMAPFIKIVRKRGGRSGGGDSGDEADGDERMSCRQKRKAKKKNKEKGKDTAADVAVAAGQDDTQPEEDGDIQMDIDDGSKAVSTEKPEREGGPEKQAAPLLAIQKIDSMETRSRLRLCICSAIGSTALIYFTLPSPSNPINLEIKCIDFGKPILNFICLQDADEVWIMMDGDCKEGDLLESTYLPLIRVIKADSGEFKEVPETEAYPALLKAINSSLISGPVDDSKRVDLYGQLTVLPKSGETEQTSPGDRDNSVPELSSTSERPLSKKELGRLKSKRAREAIAQTNVVNGAPLTSVEIGGSQLLSGSQHPEPDAEAERDAKKTKCEVHVSS